MRMPRTGTMAIVTLCAVSLRCAGPCESLWSSEQLPSPDGLWVADQRELACDAGLFTEFGRVVELRRASEVSRRILLTLDGDWREPDPVLIYPASPSPQSSTRTATYSRSYQAVSLRWASAGVLEVIVPNLTEAAFKRSDYNEAIQIRVICRDDNPSERHAWFMGRYDRRQRAR
jgi:hypothetical protein